MALAVGFLLSELAVDYSSAEPNRRVVSSSESRRRPAVTDAALIQGYDPALSEQFRWNTAGYRCRMAREESLRRSANHVALAT
jgi:hypothetical protein